MNLYIEASKVLNGVHDKTGSVKNLVYKSEFDNKKQLLALVCQTLKFGDVLQEIVDNTDLLNTERLLKNDRYLAQTLVYDSVFGKGLFRAGKLKQTMTRHKADINAECDRLKSDAGVEDLLDLVSSQNGHADKEVDSIPRYVRVNTLKTTTDCVIREFETEGWEQLTYSQDYDSFIRSIGTLQEGQFMKDLHIPDLLVFPPSTDLHDNKLCNSGEIILQDKASCFPAFVLSPPEGAFVIDCCAAPGNKTSHLASIMQNKGKIFAFDKSKERMKVLKELTNKAGVSCVETYRQNFCMADLEDESFSQVEYVLVDPSCSGSGIVGRMNHVTDDESSNSKERLQNLAAFQTSILLHALSFPNVKKVVYSTCSVFEEENEEVVEKVMSEIHEKFKVKTVISDWPERGHGGHEHAHKCLRMSSEKALTNGFFVACFKRRKEKSESVETNENSDKRKHEIDYNDSRKKQKLTDEIGCTRKNLDCGERLSCTEQEMTDDQKSKKKRKKHKKEKSFSEINDEGDSAMNIEKELGDKVKTKKKKHKERHMKSERENGQDQTTMDTADDKDEACIDDSVVDNLQESETDMVNCSKHKKKKKHKKDKQ